MRRIPLRRRDGSVRAYALVDDEDFARLGGFRWSLHSRGYAYRAVAPGRTELLHRAVAGLAHGDGREVDHRNRQRLDCRRENLRVTTRAGNAQNQSARGGRSRFRGVSWHKGNGMWQATVRVAGTNHSAGYFRDELEAAIAIEALRRDLLPFAEPDPELARALLEREALAA